jgi:hypothetical protein
MSATETGLRFAAPEVDSSCETPSQPSKSRALNPTRFLLRNFLLKQAAETRAHKFDRVSEGTLIEINEAVRGVMISKVRSLPSKGKTI